MTTTNLGALAEVLGEIRDMVEAIKGGTVWDEDSDKEFLERMRPGIDWLTSANAPISAELFRVELSRVGLASPDEMHESLKCVLKTLRAEMEQMKCFTVSPGDTKFLSGYNPPLFGPNVDSNFPRATQDIKEAGNCRAFDRPTACIFHLMRAAEIALQALHKGLGLAWPAKAGSRNWGQLIGSVESQIATDLSTWSQDKQEFYSSVSTLLKSMGLHWRNKAMHPEGHFDMQDAQIMYEAVKNLMQHMAKHLDENGVYT